MDDDRFKWLCVNSSRGRRHLATEIERIVREGRIEGTKLKPDGRERAAQLY